MKLFFMKTELLNLKKRPNSFFLQRLRDEAHRFAISTHRAKRRKNLRKSLLDQISGIGRSEKELYFITLAPQNQSSLQVLKI